MARGRAPGPGDGPAHRRPREPGGGGTARGGARAPPRVHRARERRRQPRQAAEGGAALPGRPPRPPGRSARVISPVRWDGSRLALLDQTRLPVEEVEKPCASWQEVADAIRTLVVRGAPAMGACGAALVPDGGRILTHCNAGALATAGYGTAGGVIRAAHERGKVALVWVDETRPVMQGSRLTAWEMVKEGIPHRLISDGAAGFVMKRGEVDLVVTGADRIA